MNLLKHETGIEPIQCPFCTRSALETGEFWVNGYRKFFVRCLMCRAQGPAGENRRVAVEKWNEAEGDEDADYE